MIAVLIVASVLLIIFLLFETRVSNPMLPLNLFRSPTFTGTNLLTFLLYAALSGTLFFLPMNLIQIQQYPATAAGAALLPFILMMFALSRWSGGLVTRYGARLPLIIGPMVAACGFALFLRPGIGGNYWADFFPPVAILGLGMAISVAPLTTVVMSSVSSSRAGVASGVNNAVARTAGLVAIAVFGIVMLHVFKGQLDRRMANFDIPSSAVQSVQKQSNKLAAIEIPSDTNPQQSVRQAVDESFVSGFRAVMAGGALLAVASALTAVFLIRTPART